MCIFADKLMYWVTTGGNPAVKMASLNGNDSVTLLTESKADYTGITLYNNCLYISDFARRSVCLIVKCTLSLLHLRLAIGLSVTILLHGSKLSLGIIFLRQKCRRP